MSGRLRKSDIELYASLMAKEIPGWNDFQEGQKERVLEWCRRHIEDEDESREKEITGRESAGLAGLVPLAVLGGMYRENWDLTWRSVGTIVVAYIVCLFLYCISSWSYDYTVLCKENTWLRKTAFVIISAFIWIMIGLQIGRI